jgi:hypothetical protein
LFFSLVEKKTKLKIIVGCGASTGCVAVFGSAGGSTLLEVWQHHLQEAAVQEPCLGHHLQEVAVQEPYLGQVQQEQDRFHFLRLQREEEERSFYFVFRPGVGPINLEDPP